METRIKTSIDFERFEYLGWQKAAARYSRFSLLTQQSVGDLIKHLNIQSGDKVLDVASGPGFLASRALEVGGEPVGIDLSEEMIYQAKRNYPNIEFRAANAEKTGFPNQRFNKIAINHGLIHFARPNIVLKELNRISRRDALIGLTLWDGPDRAIAFSIVSKAVSDFSTIQTDVPKSIPMSFYSNKENVRELFQSNGWTLTEFIHLPVVWKLETPESIVDILMEGTVLMASKLKKQPKFALNQIKNDVAEKLKPYITSDGRVEVPQGVILVVGKKVIKRKI